LSVSKILSRINKKQRMSSKTLFINSWEYEKMKNYESMSCGIQLPCIESTTQMVRYATIQMNRELQLAFISELDILINIFHYCNRAIAKVYPNTSDYTVSDKNRFISDNASFFRKVRSVGKEGYTILLGHEVLYIENNIDTSITLQENEILIIPRIVHSSSPKFIISR